MYTVLLLLVLLWWYYHLLWTYVLDLPAFTKSSFASTGAIVKGTLEHISNFGHGLFLGCVVHFTLTTVGFGKRVHCIVWATINDYFFFNICMDNYISCHQIAKSYSLLWTWLDLIILGLVWERLIRSLSCFTSTWYHIACHWPASTSLFGANQEKV